MDTTAVIAIFTPLMPLMTAALKHFFPEVNPKVFSFTISATISILAGLAKLFLEEATLNAALATAGVIVTFVFGIGTGLYKVQK
jgi:hypothetical protein